ncbi:MAG: RluA family pseudouridine synthase [Prevotellaceae bacterium]|jgi:23S rRNA pseudouridine1911/1915/1917 synthase|nr:RluA family pseudouridine synthase [Prevotellaceae bacterium]
MKKGKTAVFEVGEKSELFKFILAKMKGMSKTKIKSLLSHKQISVNDKIETGYNFPLHENDHVTVNFSKPEMDFHHAGLQIIYEDDYLIVVNKSEGLLAVATGKQEETTAFRIIKNYLQKQNRNNKLYIVHRIDRETSGVLLFAKQKDIQLALQENWHKDVHERVYYALVEGIVEKDSDSIVSWLNGDDKSKKVYSSLNDNGGQKAITNYQVIKRYDKLSLLRVELKTGRKNQIRVHMQSIGHPVAGDKKYGSVISPIGRVGLHAAILTLRHPVTKQIIKFETEIPKKMAKIRFT